MLSVVVVVVVDFDWVWDMSSCSPATLLSCDNRKVNFHSEYSCGSAAIRGSKELADGQHFWEIKMTSPVYGTDMVQLHARTHARTHTHTSNICYY